MDNLYQPVGAFYHDGACDFTVWAPLKDNVQLIVSHPFQKTYPMHKDDAGYWKISLPDVKPGLRYQFKLDNDLVRPDPASLSQPAGVHEASEVLNRAYSWTDSHWKGIPLDDAIIYELHVGTFTPAHTFEGVIEKLPYLLELGINAIEIMPVAQFPGSRNWGYDGVYPFAVQQSYGGAEGLKKLVNAAHEKGIAVILDVVYNHMGPEGGYLSDFAPYYTSRHKTPWGNSLNFDDAYSDGVRSYFLQNALMWLDEFHIDGLRLDAVHAIVDYGAKHFTQVLSKHIKELEEKSGRHKFLIAEIDLNNPRYINPESKGGYAMDGQWIDEFHHAMHSVLTGETDGYYEDFGKLSQLGKAFRDTYVYNGCYSPHRKKIFGARADDNHYRQFVVFSQNHDQVGNRMLGDRLSTLVSFEALKLAAALFVLSPYVPMLFMGEEYGETAPFLYFTSHTDEELVRNVREGRKKEFSYFKFTGEFPDPQSDETFKKSMLSWQWKEGSNGAMFAYYKELIALRKSLPALQPKERSSMKVFPVNKGNVLTIERTSETTGALIVFHCGDAPTEYELPVQGTFRVLFNSATAQWNGPVAHDSDQTITDNKLTLQPFSALLLEPQIN